MPRHLLISDVHTIAPSSKATFVERAAFYAMAKASMESQVYALAQYISRDNSDPQLIALAPALKNDEFFYYMCRVSSIVSGRGHLRYN